MPTYEYACAFCAHTFELFQSMTEAPKKKCPECGKKITRLFGAGSGLVFKGSGFYQTDYKKTSSAPAKKPTDGGAPKDTPVCKTDAPGTGRCAKKGGCDA